jgi:hypothetical protein
MHNKLHWGDVQLHGSAGGGDLASASVSAATPLNHRNITLMAGVLGTNRPQWTGGCAALNDPLRGL